jgi:hypothetical protein
MGLTLETQVVQKFNFLHHLHHFEPFVLEPRQDVIEPFVKGFQQEVMEPIFFGPQQVVIDISVIEGVLDSHFAIHNK